MATVKSNSYKPTNKWWAARVVAVGGWLTALIENGYEVNTSLAILGVAVVVEAATSFLVPNADTPGGVPA